MTSTSTPTPAKPQRRARLVEIDALRGIAALSVVLFHYTTRYAELFGHTTAPLFSLPWGHLGVNLFFIISGFVIFMTLERTGRAFDFVVSRFSRLYPAYWAAVALTFTITHLGGMVREQVTPGVALLNLTMLQDFLKIPSVDGAYWTLAVELIFYAWALLLFRTRMLGRIHLFVGALLALRLVYHYALVLAGVELSWTLGHLLLLDYMPWFGSGIMLYRRAVAASAPASTPAPTPRMDWAVIGTAVVTLWIVDGVDKALLLVFLGAVVQGATHGKLGVLRHRSLATLGAISYALYLVHENIGWTVIHLAEGAGLNANLAIACALASSGLLAWLIHRHVEQPALQWIRARHTRHSPDDGVHLGPDALRQQVNVVAIDEAVVGLDGERQLQSLRPVAEASPGQRGDVGRA